MKLIEFTVELHGNREVSLNGVNVQADGANGLIDEKAIANNVDARQVFTLLCLLKKMTAQLEYAYTNAMLRSGEITEMDIKNRQQRIKSGAGAWKGRE